VPEEVLVGGATPEPLTEVRSTLLGSSFLALKERGHARRYLALLPRELHDTIQFTPAGVWLPASVAEAHYGACDALGLPDEELQLIADAVARITRPTMVKTAATIAGAAGATPWTVLATADRFWGRVYRGSGLRIVKGGPKEARLDVLACPLARFRYFRVGLRAIIHGTMLHFVQTAYVREQGSGPEVVVYRLSWV
jgi:hypothetical protein